MSTTPEKPTTREIPNVSSFVDEELSPEERARLYGAAPVEEKPDHSPEAAAEDIEEFKVPLGPEHTGIGNSHDVYRSNLDQLLPRVEVTEDEQAAFEESIVLNNEPFSSVITIAGKSREFSFHIRARMAHEYRLIYLLVAKEVAEKRLPDYPAMLTRMQEFAMAVMLTAVCDKEFIQQGILPNPWKEAESDGADFEKLLEKAYKDILRRTTEKVDSMSQPLFMLALDAFRIFEAKCFIMLPDIMNKPFPGPGQPQSY